MTIVRRSCGKWTSQTWTGTEWLNPREPSGPCARPHDHPPFPTDRIGCALRVPEGVDDNYQTLTESLAELERTDPTVRAAAESYTSTVDQILEGRVHALPCHDTSCRWHHDTKEIT